MDNKKATLELGTKPIGKLLAQYALPAIVAMTASSLYNTIDCIFIGQGVGPLAIAGLGITFPLMTLAGAFGASIGVGSSTCISLKLGEKDYEMAEQIFGTSIVLNIVVGLAFGLISLIFLNPILYFFGASVDTLPYAREYLIIILLGNVFSHTYFGMNAILRATGRPRHAMYATIFTVILNVILAPIFIWVFKWGIRGAALATIIAQFSLLMWQLKQFSNKNDIIHFKRGIYKLKKDIVMNIFGIGISPFLMSLCGCIVVIVINNSLVHYGGDMAVGAFGISNKVAFIFLMIAVGLNQGMFPIASYNYGAGRVDRVLRVLKYTILTATIITTIGFIVVHLFPYECARLFTTDKSLIDLSMKAIQINLMAFPIVGLQQVTTGFFQCIGKVKFSIFLALSRQLLFLLPMIAILPLFFKLDGVWIAMPSADIIATIVAAIMLLVYLRKLKKQAKPSLYEEHNN